MDLSKGGIAPSEFSSSLSPREPQTIGALEPPERDPSGTLQGSRNLSVLPPGPTRRPFGGLTPTLSSQSRPRFIPQPPHENVNTKVPNPRYFGSQLVETETLPREGETTEMDIDSVQASFQTETSTSNPIDDEDAQPLAASRSSPSSQGEGRLDMDELDPEEETECPPQSSEAQTLTGPERFASRASHPRALRFYARSPEPEPEEANGPIPSYPVAASNVCDPEHVSDEIPVPCLIQPDQRPQSRSTSVVGDSLKKVEIDLFNPIPTLFRGQTPYLDHAKALVERHQKEKTRSSRSSEEDHDTAQASGEEGVEDERIKRVGIVAKVQTDVKTEFLKRFECILEKTSNLFETSSSRQDEIVETLKAHSRRLAEQGEKLKETKTNLTQWSRQIMIKPS